MTQDTAGKQDAVGDHCDVVTFGEALGSLRSAGMIRHGGAMSLSLAGAETNVAIGLARLGHRVRWTGRLGADEVGALAARELRAEGVVIDRVVFDDSLPTAVMLVEKRVADISRVSYYRAGSAGSALEARDLHDTFDQKTRVLHVTGITPALSPSAAEAALWAVRTAKELGIRVSLDVNYRSALWSRAEASAVLAELAACASIVFASDDELSLLGSETSEQEASARLLGSGVEEVVVKRGGDGATVWSASGELSVPAVDVPVIDTVGAGDAFTAGYLSALLDGEPVAARLDRGTILGAFSVSGVGDWEALPRRNELALLGRAAGHTIR